jgi:hypothetical protein
MLPSEESPSSQSGDPSNAAGTSATDRPIAPQATPEQVERYTQEVADARELLEWALAEGRPIPDDIVLRIKEAETVLGAMSPSSLPLPPVRSRFEQAYRDLAQILTPVTIRTLRATGDEYGRPSLWSLVSYIRGRPVSIARIWSRKLWLLTVAVVAFAILGENIQRTLTQFFPADEESKDALLNWHIAAAVLGSLTPFTYGALGACTYLLRSCHQFIYKREFDPNRIPEYLNRILLGMVSGSAILLFIEQIASEDGTIRLSAAALAFLAGYNTDFLFQTLERVAAAILPKVGVETVARGAPTPSLAVAGGAGAQDTMLRALLDRLEKAQSDQEKEEIRGYIDRLLPRR